MAPMKHDRELQWIPISKIIQNEKNPRDKVHFSEAELASLRNSIQTHGILQPVIVRPYDDDMFLLLDGERRYTSAKQLGKVKELPAIIVNRMSDHDEVVVMYNVHTQHRGWEMADELRALKELMERDGNLSERDLATELGMTVTTLKDRLRVLNMGDEVVAQIGKEDLDYSSVLRVDQVATTLEKRRPDLVEALGGRKGVTRKLLAKAKARKGISQELVEIKRDLADVYEVSDEAVRQYVLKPEATKHELRKQTVSLEEKRKVQDFSKELRRWEREIRTFRIDLAATPNLRELRKALASLVDAAQGLEERVLEASSKQSRQAR
jgi:ParB family chromosome partitioning protein